MLSLKEQEVSTTVVCEQSGVARSTLYARLPSEDRSTAPPQTDSQVTPAVSETVMESALVTVRNAVNRPQGLTRLAVDDLVENLAVMAEMGRLQSGIHYLIPQDQQQVTIRLDSCLAEYRRFHRETQLDGELLDKGAYQKQIRENQERNGYVLATSQAVRFSDLASRKRAVIIDPERAEDVGLDLSGFIVEDD